MDNVGKVKKVISTFLRVTAAARVMTMATDPGHLPEGHGCGPGYGSGGGSRPPARPHPPADWLLLSSGPCAGLTCVRQEARLESFPHKDVKIYTTAVYAKEYEMTIVSHNTT